jgi:hypothetical protein
MQLEKNPGTRRLYRRLLILEDKVRGLAFPALKRVKQITLYHCGPAVLSALYSYMGEAVSQRSLVHSIRGKNKIKRYGLTVADLAKAAKIAGRGDYSFWRKNNSTIGDLDRVINKFQYPAGVEWQGMFYEYEDEDNGHYGIVTRIDKKTGTLRLSDPFFAFAGVDRKFTIKEFAKRWWDQNEVSVAGTTRKRTIFDYRVMFVITPKGETWPKKLGMKRV